MDHSRRKHALEKKREKLARIIQGERKAKTGFSIIFIGHLHMPENFFKKVFRFQGCFIV